MTKTISDHREYVAGILDAVKERFHGYVQVLVLAETEAEVLEEHLPALGATSIVAKHDKEVSFNLGGREVTWTAVNNLPDDIAILSELKGSEPRCANSVTLTKGLIDDEPTKTTAVTADPNFDFAAYTRGQAYEIASDPELVRRITKAVGNDYILPDLIEGSDGLLSQLTPAVRTNLKKWLLDFWADYYVETRDIAEATDFCLPILSAAIAFAVNANLALARSAKGPYEL